MLDNLQIKILRDPVVGGGIDRNKFRMMEGKRLCGAIDLWLKAHMQANPVNKFRTESDASYRTIVEEIAEHIEAMNRASLSFTSALKLLKRPVLTPGTGPVKGQYGIVTTGVLNQIIGGGTQITRQAVAHACGAMAAKFGQDGVKVLKGKYLAELKIMKMGNERVVASSKKGAMYSFDKVVNKNEI